MSIDRKKAYYYRQTGEPKYSGLALDVHLHQRQGEDWKELWFDDTVRGHMIPGEVVRETPDGFVFRSDGYKPGEWVFQELTIETFRRWIYKRVGAGEIIAAKIRTTADLHEWYRKNYGFPTED